MLQAKDPHDPSAPQLRLNWAASLGRSLLRPSAQEGWLRRQVSSPVILLTHLQVAVQTGHVFSAHGNRVPVSPQPCPLRHSHEKKKKFVNRAGMKRGTENMFFS